MLALQLFAGNFEKGAEAFESGDCKTAFKYFKPLAEQGNVTAQFNLGLMYVQGEGVSQNFKKAVYWCQKAAEQGEAEAQFFLGAMYALELGCPTR